MAKMAAEDCTCAHAAGDGFTLEHPGRSYAHELPEWIALSKLKGVKVVRHHHCMFEPCEHRKYQIEYTNIPEVAEELDLLCASAAVCSRTGRPHASWQHEVQQGRVTHFSTGDLTEYPAGLCKAKARGYVRYLKRVGPADKSFVFLQVFSGPNAPLTGAVRAAIALEVLGSAPRPLATTQREIKPLTRYQLAELATGRQPKWSSTQQLIKDGLIDDREHFRLAK